MQKQNYQWDKTTVGVCYYPDHWPQSLWESDLRRMKEAGIRWVRIAEFGWSIFEPEEGVFSFDLFDSFLELCEKEGMKVILGTPTATPPAWLTEKYPESLNALKDGTLLRHGARRHYNYNAPVYRELCARIVTKLAEHYGKNPVIMGWQIDNELNCETDEFYSEADHAAFRTFLKDKYQDIKSLNEAWGTVFWSETYNDFEQIYCPRPVLNGGYNPHLLLDYKRFVSESCISFAGMQAEILRKYIRPGVFITTNGLFGNLDNHRLQNEVLDVYSYDSYPDFAYEIDRDPLHSKDLNDRKWTKNLIETRSVCPHFGIMEQQSGTGGWVNRMEMGRIRPGQLTLWAMQSAAQGADYISFFRWRTCTFGTEMYWHGILDYDNQDNRKLEEVKDFVKKFEAMGEVAGAKNKAAFALLKDYDNVFDAELDAIHRRIAKYSEAEIFAASELCHTPYEAVYINDDTAAEELADYPVAFYPHPVIMTEERAQLLKEYVENGGILVLGCRAGLKDINGICEMKVQPGLLRELTGTEVREFGFVSPDEPQDAEAPLWQDLIRADKDVKVLASYRTGPYEWEPCMTEHPYGEGKVIHLGTVFTRERVKEIFKHLDILEYFDSVVTAPEIVQLVEREKDGKTYLFALNYGNKAEEITLHRAARALFTGRTESGKLTLPAYGTAVWEIL